MSMRPGDACRSGAQGNDAARDSDGGRDSPAAVDSNDSPYGMEHVARGILIVPVLALMLPGWSVPLLPASLAQPTSETQAIGRRAAVDMASRRTYPDAGSPTAEDTRTSPGTVLSSHGGSPCSVARRRRSISKQIGSDRRGENEERSLECGVDQQTKRESESGKTHLPSRLASSTRPATRSSSASVSFPPLRSRSAATACSVDPSKNVLSRCASAPRRAASFRTVGR